MAADHLKKEDEPGGGNSKKPVATTIDFHSGEFNFTDDLNDYSGNYLYFETLDGIITADMRHQMERRQSRASRNPSGEGAGPAKNIEQSENESEQAGEDPPPLTVSSQGRTLIVDADAERAVACGKHLNERGLSCTILVPKNPIEDTFFPPWEGLVLRKVNSVSISGAFGGFSAVVTVKGKKEKLSKWPGNEPAVFDLVLDLQSTPSYTGAGLPLGYYAPGPEPASIAEVMEELPELRGQFEKPRFTVFLKNRCLHGRSRISNCRRCVDVCPVGAINSGNREISIDSYICQGCGCCALVCPAAALHMATPSLKELLNTLQNKLETGKKESGCCPTLIISDSETALGVSLPGKDETKDYALVYYEVESAGYVGLEMLLAALAWGAGKIVLVLGEQSSPGIRTVVQEQIQMAGAFLAGLAMPDDMIRLVIASDSNGSPVKMQFPAGGPDKVSNNFLVSPAGNLPGEEKRAVIRWAAQYLHDQSGSGRSSISLPTGATFGAVTIDAATCTLCMACAVACPSHALFAGGDVPRLEFIESRCHQCGLCKEICPEGSMQLLPRILCDSHAVDTSTVLHEVEPFRCVECGAPFATRAMIDRMQVKLTGHWMYANERQLRRLQMCRICRTRDALTSQDMESWNP